jgi:hypothetical protein
VIGNYNQRSFRGTAAERLATPDLDFRFGDIYIEEDTGGTVYIFSFDATAGGFFWLPVQGSGVFFRAPYGIDGYVLDAFPAGPAFNIDLLRAGLATITTRLTTFPAQIRAISAVFDVAPGTDVTFTPEIDGVPIAGSLTVLAASTGGYTVLDPMGPVMPEKSALTVRAESSGATTGFSVEVTLDLVTATLP